MTVEPFLKWPGGKRWLVSQYSDLLPRGFQRYFEPFLGGGAVFFYLSPKQPILSDTNGELINTYRCLKTNASAINDQLSQLNKKHSTSLYYRIRDTQPLDSVERAVRFLYLNRTCFNGIYRVNKRGEFNVPMGGKTLVAYPDGYLEMVAVHLKHASIRVADFEETIDKAGEGDFIFVDPPYTVMHNNNNFVKYNASLFAWSDQIRLSAAVKRATRRGAQIMISNADHESVWKLYAGYGYHHRVRRSSVLAAESAYRRETTELLITSYKP